jgi:hypothetical protein
MCSAVENVLFLIGLVMLRNNCRPTVLANDPSWKELLNSNDCTHFTEMLQLQRSTDSDELDRTLRHIF